MGRKRSSRRGKKNVNQKELRQKQDGAIGASNFYPREMSDSEAASSRRNNDYNY